MARTRGYGADLRAIVAIESSYGVAPGAGYKSVLLSNFDAGIQDPMQYEPELGLGAQDTDPFYEGQRLQPSFEVHAGLQAIGFWLKGLLGAPTTSGAGPYTHVFQPTVDVPSLSLEEGAPNLTTALYWAILGFKLSTMGLDFGPTGVTKLRFSGIAKSRGRSTTSLNGAPTAYAQTGIYKWFNQNAKFQWEGSDLGFVLGGTLEYSNNVEAQEEMTGDGSIAGADETNRSCTGELRMRLTSTTTIEDAANNKTPGAAKLVWTTPANVGWSLALEIGRCWISPRGAAIQGPGGIERTFGLRGARVTTTPVLKATLVNDVAAY